ncbi:response regulator [Rubripirellula amarantea]|nr:response regulator [Rubripirellula amarantea]
MTNHDGSELNPTVLVVDDTDAARRLIVRTLDRIGFSTIVAIDGESALHNIRDFRPDAIVTDLEMPGMDGESLIEKLRSNPDERVRELPVIVCSSKNDLETRRNLLRLGVNAIVPKPVDVRMLARRALKLFKII